MLFLTFGIDANNEYISIDAVKSGKTSLACPFCKQSLIAKKGKVKVHHFAHDGDTCAQSSDAIKAIQLPFFDTFNVLDKHEQKYVDKLTRYRSHEYIYSFTGMREAIKSLEVMGVITVDKLAPRVKDTNQRLINLNKGYIDSEGKPTKKLLGILEALAPLDYTDKILEHWDSKYIFQTAFTAEYQRFQHEHRRSIGDIAAWQSFWIDAQYRKVKHFNTEFLPLLTARIKLLNEQKLYIFYFDIMMDGVSHNVLKIGMTSRLPKDRLKEVKSELSKHCTVNIAKVAAVAHHAGRIERLLHKKYEDKNVRIGDCKMTEFFKFSDEAELALIRQVQELDIDEYSVPISECVSTNEKRDTESNQVQKAGRKKKTNEQILVEYPALVELLKQGKGIRETSRIAQVAINTVRKVNDALKADA